MPVSRIKKDKRRSKRQKAKNYSAKRQEAKRKQEFKNHVDAMMAKIITPESDNHDLLYVKCDPYEVYADAEKDISEITEVLQATAKGVGLAAPQIGITKQAMVWRKTPMSPINHMVNPKIVKSSEEKQSMSEGCLSYPGFFVEIERPIEIEVEFNRFNETETITETFKGWEARVIQHEIDHLNGICLVGDSPEESRQYVKSKK